MSQEHIISIIEMYEERLRSVGAPKIRMDPSKTFQSLNQDEILAHAHFICDGVKEYAKNPLMTQRKTGSHLSVVQMCLSFAGWYTLSDLMDHNRPLSD